jgi:preprotein translocase subunit Sec63
MTLSGKPKEEVWGLKCCTNFSLKWLYNLCLLRGNRVQRYMRIILIGIIIFVIIYILLFLRRVKGEKGPYKISRCIEILGLKPGASQDEVNQAYRDLVNVWHPDRFVNNPRLQKKAEGKIKEINAAYEYIKSFYYKM